MIRIGANPIGWSNDDMLEVGGDIPLEQCLNEARRAGYVGMELGNKFPRTAEKLKPLLGPRGLQLVSGWYSTELLTRDVAAEMVAAEAHATLLQKMGCEVMIIAETSNGIHGKRDVPLSARPVLAREEWPEFGARLTGFAARLRDQYGLRAVYHHHMGTVIQTEAEIDRLMKMTSEPLHLLLDSGHATWGGGSPERIARHYKNRISHVHAKDVREESMWRAQRGDLSFLDAVLDGVYTVPGDGIVDFLSMFKALEDYSGWIIVEAEQDPKKYPPAHYAKLGFDNLKWFLKKSGLGT